MVEGAGSGPAALTPEDRAIRELAAARDDMVAAVTRQIAYYVEQCDLPAEEAGARARERLKRAPDAKKADQVSWNDLANLVEHNADRAQTL